MPSQQGFGTDLSASDTIIPIVDLTAAAEGSDVPIQLQEALGFSDITAWRVNNTLSVIANTPGFYKLGGQYVAKTRTSTQTARLELSDGVSIKNLWQAELLGVTTAHYVNEFVEFTVFLQAGETLSAASSGTEIFFNGYIRQIADINGVLTNPSGFTPQ